MANPTILILAGDGIGPEVMAEVKKIIGWFDRKRGVRFDVSEDLVGGCAYDKYGTPLHDDTMAKAQAVDAVLLGAVGGPKGATAQEKPVLRAGHHAHSAVVGDDVHVPQVAQSAGVRVPGALAGVAQEVGALDQRVGRHVQWRGVGQRSRCAPQCGQQS